MPKETRRGREHPANLCADALALVLAAGLPLFMPNGYVGLIGQKFRLLLACTLVALAGVLAGLALWRRRSPALRRPAPSWLWPVGMCAAYTAAWLLAEDRRTAFWGLSGRNNGLLLWLACTLVFCLTAALVTPCGAALTRAALVAAGAVTTLISWLNYWMLDPLDAYYTFLPERGELFLGTMGNINFFGALLCLCAPLAVAPYLWQGSGRRHWRYWGSLFLCGGLIPAGSDGAWLGFAATLAVLCCTSRATTRTLGRVMSLLAGLLACGVVTGLLGLVWEARSPLRTTSAALASPWALLPCAVCALAAWRLLRMRERGAAVAARVVVGALVLAALAAILAANLLPVCPGALSALHFDERWAANRGYAWQRLWIVYTQDTSWWQKLIGLGGDAVSARLNPDVESVRYMTLLNGEPFDSAHNEFLQHLVCGGLVGLVCWCGFLVSSVRRGWRRQPELSAAIVGYGVQSFFSISMPGALPLVFVLAGLTFAGRETGMRGAPASLVAGAGLWLAALLLLPFLPCG